MKLPSNHCQNIEVNKKTNKKNNCCFVIKIKVKAKPKKCFLS